MKSHDRVSWNAVKFYILIWEMFTWMYAFVKVHQVVHLRLMHFFFGI